MTRMLCPRRPADAMNCYSASSWVASKGASTLLLYRWLSVSFWRAPQRTVAPLSPYSLYCRAHRRFPFSLAGKGRKTSLIVFQSTLLSCLGGSLFQWSDDTVRANCRLSTSADKRNRSVRSGCDRDIDQCPQRTFVSFFCSTIRTLTKENCSWYFFLLL